MKPQLPGRVGASPFEIDTIYCVIVTFCKDFHSNFGKRF
ncbi:hypothetical protein XCR1_1190007 [Xenorhabdus cabanillasii JM26]|uniref:Uncharacterized protein n=1 Tax=Xenorhabdus cabanillasii JM26 TaxID=1427517 RepID=W1IMG7_9GAMM|nr:hypothetical protein XCR1_1190007 [Xenorhabdus cabanillasii JM26]